MTDLEFILNKLEDNGFKSYIVGGYLRDKYLNKSSSDVDIATLARPSEIKEIFKDLKIIDIGKKFGTIKVIKNSKEFEITTFRSDMDYKDMRHPDKIKFSNSIYEDLKRRDFTINAMAYRKKELIDPFGGLSDINDKVIRAVGDANERIKEDYLRALRAIRFAAVLDFSLDEDLFNAIRQLNQNISYISKERINVELSKILTSKKPKMAIELLRKTGLLKKLLPEVDDMYGFDQHSSFHDYDLYTHSLKVLENTKEDLITRIAALFHDTGKIETFFIDERGEGRFFGHQELSSKLAQRRLRKLKFSKDLINRSSVLISRHMDNTNDYTRKSIRKLIRRVGDKDIYRLLDLQKADILATNHNDLSNIYKAYELIESLKDDELSTKKNFLKINGHELIKIGYQEGKEIGKLLEELNNMVLDERIENDKKTLLKYAKDKLN
ncbi:MAG: HD domain-containing protein [Tissierellia bacterium]|nr:HD domain-containing protein [Tissierellia bacterium]